MLAQSTPISYHTEAFVKTEVGCAVTPYLILGCFVLPEARIECSRTAEGHCPDFCCKNAFLEKDCYQSLGKLQKPFS